MPEDACVRRTQLLFASAVLALLLPVAPAAAGPQRPYRDVRGVEATLTADATGRSWSGSQQITVRNAGGTGEIDRLWLRLWGNGPVGCPRQAVRVTAVDGARRGRLLRDCTALELLLPAPLPRGAATTLALQLQITAPAVRDRFGRSDGINLFGNALPTLAQRDRGGWRLPSYSPYGESWVTTVAPYRLELRHAAALQVSASGVTTRRELDDLRAVTTSTITAREVAWAAGTMAETARRTKRGVLVRVWSHPESAADREDNAASAADAIDELERRLPSYAYGELDVVLAEIDAGGGMEYPAFVISDGGGDVTRHEVAHQWFYAMVGSDQYREPWVDEGVTSFLEYTWTAGDQPAPQCWPAAQLSYPNRFRLAASSMTYWNRHPGRYILAYNNPVCALRDQQRLLGAARFTKVLRTLAERYADGFITAGDLRGAFRRSGGKRSDAIWRRWGLAPG